MALHMDQAAAPLVTEDRPSTVIAFLPMVVQSRINRHIRRSISLSGICTAFMGDEPLGSRSQSDSTTLTSEMALRREMQLARAEVAGRRVPRGKYARQGVQLVGMSVAGNDLDVSKATAGDFERDAYIDGLTYLLRGLPEDLTNQERNRLQLSLPVDLQLSHNSTAGSKGFQAQSKSSPLYRLTCAAVVNLVILISLLLPYLLMLLQWLAATEKRFKVSETMGQYACLIISAIGNQGVRAINASKGREARLGQLVMSRLLWTVEEVSRGVSDGVDRGLSGARLQSW